MNRKEFFTALDDLEREKRIKKAVFLDALEQALAIAYKKHFGIPKGISIKLNPERNSIKIIAYQNVVEEVTDKDKEISLEEARDIKKSAKVGDILTEEVQSKDFGRIVAQTAKQVLMQKLRDIENTIAYGEIAEKEEQLITCVIRRQEDENFFVEINKMEAILLKQDQLPQDRTTLRVGDKVKVFVKKIKAGPKGPQVQVTRANPGFVQRLFELEVPEIASGLVVVKNIVRDPGYRTKIAVYSEDSGIDPVGACVGNRGMRVNSIVSELGGEKIDIIPWCSDALEFIARALSPAKVLIVQVNDEEKTAKVVVPDDKLSLAIGKGGQNARLAAKLTGWKIDVKSYTASLQMNMTGEDDEPEEAAESAENAEDIFGGIEEMEDLE